MLLPHMCLNRYDVAEGVRTYSQATWTLILGQEGREWVGRCITQARLTYIALHFTVQISECVDASPKTCVKSSAQGADLHEQVIDEIRATRLQGVIALAAVHRDLLEPCRPIIPGDEDI